MTFILGPGYKVDRAARRVRLGKLQSKSVARKARHKWNAAAKCGDDETATQRFSFGYFC